MTNPSKYIKNSKLHQALDALSRMPMTELDLRHKISFTASVPRFNLSIINPLVGDRYARREHMFYKITPEGEELLNNLGRIKSKLSSSSKFVPEGCYDGKELTKAAVRISGDDHFKHPSRRNDMLFYRDGRVEAV